VQEIRRIKTLPRARSVRLFFLPTNRQLFDPYFVPLNTPKSLSGSPFLEVPFWKRGKKLAPKASGSLRIGVPLHTESDTFDGLIWGCNWTL